MRITALWSRDATVVFDFELDSGMVAFVDREWSLRGESVPALLVGREEVAWWDGSAVGDHQALPATIALDAQQVASGIIAAIASTAVAAVAEAARAVSLSPGQAWSHPALARA